MPYKAGAVITEFKSNLKSLKAGIKEGKGQLDSFANKAKRTGKKMQTIGRGMTKYVTLPMTIAAGAVTKFGMDFEDAMQQSVSIMDGVTPEIRKQMEEVARAVALDPEIDKSAKDAAESYFYLASAGLDAKQAMEALPQVAKFATAGQFDMAQATDLLTDSQSALGLTVKDSTQNLENMAEVSDVLVKANTLANASVQQFSESLTNRAAAAMRNANQEIEEGVAVLAAFADRGVKGRKAGMRYSQMLRFMQKAAVENKAALRKHNVEIFDSQGNLNNMADIVEDLTEELSGMTDEQKTSALAAMGFTAETQGVIKTLMGAQDQIRGYQKELENAAGITDKVASKQMESLKKQLGLVKDLFIEVALQGYEFAEPTIKDLIIPALKSLAKFLGDVGEKFNDLPPGVQKVIGILGLLLMAAGPVLAILGQIVTMIGGLAPVVSAASGAIAGAGGLTAAVTGLATVLGPFALGGMIIAGLAAFVSKFVQAQREVNLLKEDLDELAESQLKARQEILASRREQLKSMIEAGRGGPSFSVEQAKNMLAEIEKDEEELAQKIKEIEERKQKLREKTTKTREEEGDEQVENAEEDEEQIAEAREKFEKDWEQKLFEATHNRIEILEREKKQAIAKARELGAETSTVREVYEKEITAIKEEQIAEREKKLEKEKEAEAEAARQIAQERTRFENQWSDKLFDFTHDRIEILKREKREAIREAKELGVETSGVRKYFQKRITELQKEESRKRERDKAREKEQVASFENSWNQKLFDLTHSRIEIMEREKEQAISEAEEMGAETEIIREYFEKRITAIKEEQLQERKRKLEKEKAEEKEAAREIYEARMRFEEKWAEKLFRLTHNEVEQLKRQKEQELEIARKSNADTADMERVFDIKINNAKEEMAEQRERMRDNETGDVETSAAERYDKKKDFEERWNEKYFRATHDRIEILKWEKKRALAEAKELGAEKLATEKYYNRQIEEAREELRKKSKEEILESVYDDLSKSMDLAIKKSKALGESYDANSKIAGYYEDAIITLLENGFLPTDNAVRGLVFDLENLNDTMNEGKTQTEKITKVTQDLKEKMELARRKNRAFGDSFDLASVQARYLKNAIIELIKKGIDVQNEEMQELISRYEELENQADDTYDSIKRVHEEYIGQGLGSIKTAEETFEEINSFLTSDFNKKTNEKQEERNVSEAVSQTFNSPSTTKNEFIIQQTIKDKATADYANNELVDKFQGKGVKESFR